ncbi:10937_t:CDS:2 [Diversispora eburnea]|uniref:10937_t:CDS:1 n=1 Tax=Diversispora eburnea TaxID=1213867 RepID=A0A9N8YY83_9GLOM|nr:10937_t:CDS:2 [Diversispora eburnea]
MGAVIEKCSDCLPTKRKTKGRGQRLGSGPPTQPLKERQQAAAAEAAERRAKQAQKRGVQKGGGKLSKKLEDQKTSSQADEPPDANLQWRSD